MILYMIIHVSFNRLSAPETKLLIYIYTVYINQNNETQLQPSSFSGYEWILFLHVAFGPSVSNLEISWLTHFNTVRLAGETVKSKGYLRKRTNHGLSMQSMPESLQICWLFHVISS